jgi:hypothetical protein
MDGPVETRHALSQVNNDKAGILRNEIRSIQRGIAGRIEQGCPQGWRGLAREVRRRPWEPPQTRWASPRQMRTTCESRIARPPKKHLNQRKKKGAEAP